MTSRKLQRKDVPVALVLAYAQEWREKPGSVPGALARLVADGFPPKVAITKLHQLVNQDLVEYGTSVNYAWPTEKGLALLRSLEPLASARPSRPAYTAADEAHLWPPATPERASLLARVLNGGLI